MNSSLTTVGGWPPPSIPPQKAEKYWDCVKSPEDCVKVPPTNPLPTHVDKWKCAMKRDIDSLTMSNTWTVCVLPPGQSVLPCKWVYVCKLDKDGSPVRYKARLVARGDLQREGLDSTETFAPVAKLASLRVLLSIAIAGALPVRLVDFDSAFVNGVLDQEYA